MGTIYEALLKFCTCVYLTLSKTKLVNMNVLKFQNTMGYSTKTHTHTEQNIKKLLTKRKMPLYAYTNRADKANEQTCLESCKKGLKGYKCVCIIQPSKYNTSVACWL